MGLAVGGCGAWRLAVGGVVVGVGCLPDATHTMKRECNAHDEKEVRRLGRSFGKWLVLGAVRRRTAGAVRLMEEDGRRGEDGGQTDGERLAETDRRTTTDPHPPWFTLGNYSR